MKLSQLAKKPVLIEIKLDDAETIDKYGEALEFWTWDRQPLSVFLNLVSVGNENSVKVIEVVKDLILDEQGKPLLTDGVMLPTSILMACIAKITEKLGN